MTDRINERHETELLYRIKDRVMRELSEFDGFFGDENTPVVVDDIKNYSSVVRYRFNHVHHRDGRCVKNRWLNYFCEAHNVTS